MFAYAVGSRLYTSELVNVIGLLESAHSSQDAATTHVHQRATASARISTRTHGSPVRGAVRVHAEHALKEIEYNWSGGL